MANKLRPNSISNDIKLLWLTEIEGQLAYDDGGEIKYSIDTDTGNNLLIANPYDRIYVDYLITMIDFHNDDLTKYNADLTQFAESYSKYRNNQSRNESIDLKVVYGE